MSLLTRLPTFLSHFLGYRDPSLSSSKHKKSLPLWRLCFWSFLAAWIGIAILEITFTYSKAFQSQHTPMIIASFGASAVLVFGVIESPLAQPRNIICGQIIGAVVGVIIAQLFLGVKTDWVETDPQYVAVQWVAGATAMALSLVVMQATGTVHPPGGATALIPAVTSNVLTLKWFYIGVVAVSAVLQVGLACLINNVERRYPMYWWSPKKLPIKVDPVVVSTVVHSPSTQLQQTSTDADDENTINSEESIILDNLSQAEEGRLRAIQSRHSHKSINYRNNSNSPHHTASDGFVQEFSISNGEQGTQQTSDQQHKRPHQVSSTTKNSSSTSASTLAALEQESHIDNAHVTVAINHALHTLQKYSQNSPIPYCVISTNSNSHIISTTTTTLDLTPEELDILKAILNKKRSPQTYTGS